MIVNILNLLVYFLTSLSIGLIIFSGLANPKKTGEGFFQLIYSLSGSGLFISFVAMISIKGYYSSYLLLLLFSSLICLLLRTIQKDHKSVSMYFLQFIIIAFGISYLNFFFGYNYSSLIITSSSLLLLGIVTYSMVMGHWYLVTPKLSAKPLINATYITWFLIFFKLCISIYFYFQNQKLFTEGTAAGGGYAFNWIMLIMRYVWGYLILFVMSVFAFKLLKIRSLQSATGILYAETFFVFVGELISMYYFFANGVLL